ncbi:MAG: GGDEF domain-containing protein [Epsilonproteobacteria bacterium]|nr:GGDEF domain-containing protein [Campylobacterota bacterium]
MQFLEALKLRSKLFFLFLLITLGLVGVGIVGALNINAMKRNIDSLYFGSLIPINELNEIVQTYHGTLAATLYKAKSGEISQDQAIIEIKNGIGKIEKYWGSYESHFKRIEEMQYVEYAALELTGMNDYFLRIISALQSGADIQKISIMTLEKNLLNIHNILKKLIIYETEVARYERRSFLAKYDDTLKEIGFALFAIVSGVLAVLFYVFKSIQNDHTNLEIATQKLRRANKKLESVSYTDSLTGLHNRRYFNLIYEREFKRAKRSRSYITFMMLDIDYFKQYNDTYGHIEGDFALKTVAKVLRDTLKRPSDFVFRLGGEEFGILLVDTDEHNSAKMAKTICDAVLRREILHSGSRVHQFMSVSIGVVCTVADEALSDEVLISTADKMLYEAKEGGRNRFVMSTEVSETTTLRVEEDDERLSA